MEASFPLMFIPHRKKSFRINHKKEELQPKRLEDDLLLLCFGSDDQATFENRKLVRLNSK